MGNHASDVRPVATTKPKGIAPSGRRRVSDESAHEMFRRPGYAGHRRIDSLGGRVPAGTVANWTRTGRFHSGGQRTVRLFRICSETKGEDLISPS